MRLWIGLVILLLSTLLVSETRADLDPFESQVYPYEVTGNGKLDPQLLSNLVPSGFRDAGSGTSSDGAFASPYMARNHAESFFLYIRIGSNGEGPVGTCQTAHPGWFIHAWFPMWCSECRNGCRKTRNCFLHNTTSLTPHRRP